MLNEIILAIEKIIEKKGRCIVALDGRCGSGKSTVAKRLEERIDCNVVHMDDFFLPPYKRSENYLDEIAGNMDLERLYDEILRHVVKGENFFYRPFSCKEGAFLKPREMDGKKVTLIEGSYSCHPYLFESSDLHIFLDTDKETQQIRLLMREGKEKLLAFNEKWIPLEEKYFSCTDIKYKCEIYYKTSV